MSTNQQHQLVISPVRYPGGLRIVQCHDCQYAFAAEFDAQGIIKMETKETFNHGDAYASHSLFQTPTIELELSFDAELETEDEDHSFFDEI
ncbi:MAG: hypothetical protein CL608_16285 [Anaerolineaceae bacterium]|nr:hypothetical protein [Anaerolineaceae bacterium]